MNVSHRTSVRRAGGVPVASDGSAGDPACGSADPPSGSVSSSGPLSAAGRAGSARTVGVVSGSGGAGGSTLAAALAVTAAVGGARVLLVDLDPFGGGADLLLGMDEVPGLRWPGLAGSRGRLPADSLHQALPRAGSLAVLSWGPDAEMDVSVDAAQSVLEAGRRGHDLVVLDLPRWLCPVRAVAVSAASELLVVVPGRLRAVAATARTLAALGHPPGDCALVVRRRSGDDLTSRQVGDALRVPVLADLRDDPRVLTAAGVGQPPGLSARSVLRRVARRCLGPEFEPRVA
jgi:secretion/DNA translocation related CpaE-like protein